jgi:hypothetical protein
VIPDHAASDTDLWRRFDELDAAVETWFKQQRVAA